MAKLRPHPVKLDVLTDLTLFAESLFELVERARQDGDRATDAVEAVLALCDHTEYLHRTVPVRELP